MTCPTRAPERRDRGEPTMRHCPSRGGEIERLGDILERVVASLKVRRMSAADNVCAEPEGRLAEPPWQPSEPRSPAAALALDGEPMAAGL